jgi:hypothetical protein
MVSKSVDPLSRDRWFESAFLQQRVGRTCNTALAVHHRPGAGATTPISLASLQKGQFANSDRHPEVSRALRSPRGSCGATSPGPGGSARAPSTPSRGAARPAVIRRGYADLSDRQPVVALVDHGMIRLEVPRHQAGRQAGARRHHEAGGRELRPAAATRAMGRGAPTWPLRPPNLVHRSSAPGATFRINRFAPGRFID